MREKLLIESRPNSSLIKINPNGLYTRADLAALLAPCGVNVDHFIARIRPRKVFKMLWTDEDIRAYLCILYAYASGRDGRTDA